MTLKCDTIRRKKEEGVILGRPKGSSKPEHYKLFGKEMIIQKMLKENVSKIKIAKKLKVNRLTLGKYIKSHGLEEKTLG